MGSDENAQLPPSGEKICAGAGSDTEPAVSKQGAEIVATLYCGDQYYLGIQRKSIKNSSVLPRSFGADAVLCGPAMHYPNFGKMAAGLTAAFNEYGIPAAAAMSAENPAVTDYHDRIPVIKMPKKGGIGLNDSYKNMAHFVSALAKGEDPSVLKAEMLFKSKSFLKTIICHQSVLQCVLCDEPRGDRDLSRSRFKQRHTS